jgi:hypothetical protein
MKRRKAQQNSFLLKRRLPKQTILARPKNHVKGELSIVVAELRVDNQEMQ